MTDGETVSLSDVEVWLTNNGTLRSVALGAILEACQERWGGPTLDCEEAVEAGSGRFRVVPADARKEFALLYRDSCPPGGDPQQCLQKIQAARLFRTLPRAQLQPRPLTMDQGVRTHFTANMIDTGTIQGQAGMPTDEGVTHDTGAPGAQKVVALIPYSARMCFALKAENPKFAKIEPDPQEGVTVENGKLCTNVSEGGSAIKYNPSWWVTPLTGNDLKLYLDLEHYVGNARKVFPYEPHPFVIDVIPKKSWWDRIDAFLTRATGTAKLATGLATAIGALITAIAAWQVWGWFKRKKASRAKPST